jgi:antitoxin component of RelBE/YafQ-DinJ toxin-antitoxin module
MSKLTLSVDASVVERAKRYARRHGVSVSKLVQLYLNSLAQPAVTAADPPVLRSLRGTLKRASVDDYRKHLSVKYR